MGNTVYVKSVAKQSVQKREEYTNVNGRRIPKNKAIGAGTRICFAYSIQRGELNTGFWEIIDNPWFVTKKEDANLPSNWLDTDIWNKQKITKQVYFEIKHNKPAGYYSSSAMSLFDDYSKGTYIQNFSYFFKDGITVLNLDIPEQEIAFEMCKMSSKIAPSKDEINPYQHLLYIAQVNEAEEEKAARREIIEGAVAALHDLKQKYPDTMIHKIVTVLELARGETIPGKNKNLLSDFVGDEAKDRMKNISRFMEIYKMLSTKDGAIKFENNYILQELVNYRIISDYQGKYTWGNAPSSELNVIAKSKQQAIEWLGDIDSKEWRKQMLDELKAKTGLKLV